MNTGWKKKPKFNRPNLMWYELDTTPGNFITHRHCDGVIMGGFFKRYSYNAKMLDNLNIRAEILHCNNCEHKVSRKVKFKIEEESEIATDYIGEKGFQRVYRIPINEPNL